ncbi:MAG: TetR/AcrR family transcriptional regulator, partial [Epsilonproteobacteria bacterium]|nr:TetR/AcrR family transcriptional regulator [Campylobacterota bacterium]
RESAIYNHYENKEAILKSIIGQIFETPFEMKEIEEKAKRGKPFLREFIVAYKLVAFDKKKEKLFRVLINELFQNRALRESFLQEFHQKDIKRLSQAFFVMMQEGLIRSNDPMFMAQEFLAPLFYFRLQLSLTKIDKQSTTALSTIFERHVDFFWESVKL